MSVSLGHCNNIAERSDSFVKIIDRIVSNIVLPQMVILCNMLVNTLPSCGLRFIYLACVRRYTADIHRCEMTSRRCIERIEMESLATARALSG